MNLNALNPLATLAIFLLVSIAINVALLLALIVKGAGPKRILDVWTGRGWDPVRLKIGQVQHVYKRADGTKVVFKLEETWAQPYGKRGLRWLGNGMNGGDMYRWSTEKKAWTQLIPPGDGGSRVDLGKWTELGEGAEPPEVEGQYLAVEWPTRAMTPSGDYLATALDDIREKKWFEGHKQAESTLGGVKPNWLLIGAAAIAVWYFFLHGGVHH